jgi:hypothetical protein
VALEPREDLSYAYCGVLSCLQVNILQKILTPAALSRLFALLGGRDEALDLDKPVVLTPASRKGIPYTTGLEC